MQSKKPLKDTAREIGMEIVRRANRMTPSRLGPDDTYTNTHMNESLELWRFAKRVAHGDHDDSGLDAAAVVLVRGIERGRLRFKETAKKPLEAFGDAPRRETSHV